MFSKISPVAKYPIASVYLYKHYIKKYVLYKNMLIFGEFLNTQSDQNIFKTHQTAPHFQNFLRGASICPWTPQHMRATIISMYFYMKIAIFYSRLFQNTYQNASIINFSKLFFTRIIFRVSKIFIIIFIYNIYIYIYIYLYIKSYQNIHQNAPNCTI